MLDLVGYAASILTIISFAMSGEKKLRAINLAGTVLFVIYAVGIGSPSIAMLNVVIIIMHILKMRDMASISLAGKMATFGYIGFSLGLLGVMLVTQAFSPIETFSFAASLILLYGLSQDGEDKIRPICAVSTFMFIGYSIMISSVPLLLSNIVLACVHVVKLTQLYRQKKRVVSH